LVQVVPASGTPDDPPELLLDVPPSRSPLEPLLELEAPLDEELELELLELLEPPLDDELLDTSPLELDVASSLLQARP